MTNPDNCDNWRDYCRDLIRQERELREQASRADREALKIKTEEMDRRLELLNGHQAELTRDRERFVLKEAYEVWRDGVNVYILTEQGRSRGLALIWVIIGGLVGLGGLAIAYFK